MKSTIEYVDGGESEVGRVQVVGGADRSTGQSLVNRAYVALGRIVDRDDRVRPVHVGVPPEHRPVLGGKEEPAWCRIRPHGDAKVWSVVEDGPGGRPGWQVGRPRNLYRQAYLRSRAVVESRHVGAVVGHPDRAG